MGKPAIQKITSRDQEARFERLSSIGQKVEEKERIGAEDALFLYQHAELTELGRLASFVRYQYNPDRQVTYLVDRNINYTNVCNSDCSFCGFYRHDPNHPESYVLSREEMAQKITEALENGATRILLQGGHNDELPYEYYVELVAWLNESFDIELNCFSPSEIHQMHLVSGKSYRAILEELQAVGLKGLPGGGAEILDDAVRKRVSPKKIMSDTWLEVMGIAHSLGLTTTASMVIGFGETLEQRINHFQALRDLQDESYAKGYEGFNAFISWPLQHNENTSLGRSRLSERYGADSVAYIRNVAVARIFLDNISHHGASWPTLGTEVGKLALHYGCDDFGSTMMEENVVSAAGAPNADRWAMSPEELQASIRQAGFSPAQRNTSYDILQRFEKD